MKNWKHLLQKIMSNTAEIKVVIATYPACYTVEWNGGR